MRTFSRQSRAVARLVVVASTLFAAGCGSSTLVGPHESDDGAAPEDATTDVVTVTGQQDGALNDAANGVDAGPDADAQPPENDAGSDGGGVVCEAGGTCSPAEFPCHNGELECGDAGSFCKDLGTPASPGTQCGSSANTFCDPAGNCSCTGNQPCTSGAVPVCHQGLTSCTVSGSQGTPICTDTNTDLDAGTPCGTGEACNSAGTCTTITCADAGQAPCTPSVCAKGVLQCPNEFGQPVCTPTGPATVGSLCVTSTDAGGVCDIPNGGAADGGEQCIACVSGGSCTPANDCDKGSLSCGATISCTDTGHATAGTTCSAADGGTANACDGNGNCDCVAGGPCVPTNACHNGIYSCSTGVQVCVDQQTAVTGNPSCGGGKFCNAGTCSTPTCATTTSDGGAVACVPTTAPCHEGAQTCATPFATPGCTDLGTPVTNCSTTTGCTGGSVCSGGACTTYTSGGSCPLANACEKGELSCTAGSGVTCGPSGTNEPPGTVCSGAAGANACDGNGNCDCTSGGTCIIAGSCKQATFSCATGTAVCTAGTTNANDGTTCATNDAGTDKVCFNGTCTACVPGAPCSVTGNACQVGATVCTSGQPVCNATGNAAPGTSCTNGADNSCDGNGNCSCAAGGTCMGGNVDPCSNGAYSCATGTAVCASGSENVSMNGKACGASSLGTCTSGRCKCPTDYEFYEGDCNECPSFAGTTVYVDAANGTDDLCCGRSQTAGFGGPCLTIGHGMAQVEGSAWTINFAGDANGNASTSESYPIQLSQGVSLDGQAAGSSCIPGTSGVAVLSASTDSTQVTVSGLTLGTTCAGISSGASYGIYINNGGSLQPWRVAISNVDQGIYVGPSSTVGGYYNYVEGGVQITNTRIGVNFDGGGSSTATNANSQPSSPLQVSIIGATQDGIHCASITDPGITSGGTGVGNSNYSAGTLIQSAARYAVYVGPGCNLSIGGPYGAVAIGPASCSTRPDNIGVYVEGNGIASIAGTISCMSGDGLVLANNTALSGTPTVAIAGVATIRNNGCAGVRAEAGSLTMYGATVTANHWGVIQQTAATGTTGIVNINGYSSGTTSDPNTIYCNGKSEAGACCVSGNCPNGANVWNDSALPLTAENNYWGDSPVAKCSCNNALASCTCSGSANGDTTPPDDVDVLLSPFDSGGAAGAVTTTSPLILTTPTCSY